MKLSDDTRDLIMYAVKSCSLVNIENLLIDKQGLRAKQDETAVYLIEPSNLSFLEFDHLFINRIKNLNQRITMFSKNKNVDFEMYVNTRELDNEEQVVTELTLKDEKTRVEFQCANPGLLDKKTLPKKIKDPIFYSFILSKESLAVLGKGTSAMESVNIIITGTDKGIKCNIKDIEGDKLSHAICDNFEQEHDESEDEFEFTYNFKILYPLLKEASKDEDIKIEITRRGIMKISLNGISMYILSEV